MRLLLIRHGETVDNVAGVYAGVRDSPLTTHGVLQASRLGSHLAKDVKVTHIFSSDLQRAFKTAEAIRVVQEHPDAPIETVKLKVLREQDFGFYEGRSFMERQRGSAKTGKDAHKELHAQKEGFVDVESKESMKTRMDAFIEQHLVEHLHQREDEETVVVVAHGIILTHLWRGILQHFEERSVAVGSEVATGNGMGLEYLGGWGNTGILDLEVKQTPVLTAIPSISVSTSITTSSESSNLPPNSTMPSPGTAKSPTPSTKLQNMSLVVKAVNNLEHLRGLKKTRGGIGSAKHDEKQQTMDSFFKKRKIG